MKLTNEQLEEAERLKQKFNPKGERKINRAQFAKDNKFPGGAAMIYQHIKGLRPISMDAALAYAKGFNCSLDEISPRLAHEARRSAASLDYDLENAESIRVHKSSTIYDQKPVISSKMTSEEEDTNASAFFHILDVKAACGEGHFNNDYHEIVRSIEMEPSEAQHLIGSMNRNNKIQIVIASKDSMIPTIQPDDLLFVDMSIKDYAGEAIYILLHGGELICKRLSIVGKTLMVSSDNKFYQSWAWDDRMEDTRIIGKVIRALPMTFKKFGSV